MTADRLKERIEGASDITPSMFTALVEISSYPRARIKFMVGEALRKRGLVTRYTIYSVRADFANQDGVLVQYRRAFDEAMTIHEWDLTKAGRSLLTALKDSDNG